MDEKTIRLVELMQQKIDELEKRVKNIETTSVRELKILKSHFIKLKNNEPLEASDIFSSKAYTDLSPEKAYELYNDDEFTFSLLDVSAKDFSPPVDLPEKKHIPLNELEKRFNEVDTKLLPLLIISEDGVDSLKAIELLVKHDYYNLYNISGGYQFWGKQS